MKKLYDGKFYRVDVLRNAEGKGQLSRTYYIIPLENRINLFLDKGDEGLLQMNLSSGLVIRMDEGDQFKIEEMEEDKRNDLVRKYGLNRLIK